MESLQKEIETKSTKPLEIIQTQDPDTLLLQGIDPELAEQQEIMDKEKKLKARNEHDIN